MFEKVRGNLVKTWILKMGIKAKLSEAEQLDYRTDTIWDKLFFDKIRKSLGGRVRILIYGSAIINKIIIDTLVSVIACPVSDTILVIL